MRNIVIRINFTYGNIYGMVEPFLLFDINFLGDIYTPLVVAPGRFRS
jgi:hypothetical protein